MKLESLALHHGYDSEPTTKSAAVPIYQTSSYTFDNTQHGADLFDLKVPGNIYTRIMNPTTDVLEQRLAAMEGGIASLAVASGMSAITYAIQCICEVGDNIVSTSQLYGGTYNLFAHSLPKQGIEVRLLSHDDFDGFEKAIDSKTKAIFCESIGNPAGNIVDIEKLAEIAHRHGVPVIVDNTVATPYLCQAFEKGADIVIHSLTKYIGGHGTSIGGVIIDSGKFDWVANKERFPVLNEPDPSYHGVIYTEALGPAAFIGRCRVVPLRNTGAAISPMNSFQILQGLETLGLRMERHCDNAEKLAQYLNTHEKVAWVNYATLPDSPYKAMSEKITGGKASGILSFGIKSDTNDGVEAGAQFIDALQMILRLVNIGDAKSLACHPASTTHRQLNETELAAAGVSDDLVRISVGIEHIDDIIADVSQALDKVTV
ncbi:MAG: O-acetylhomoserine (thiol)-lyase [Gammaproteobacteria bacterium]|jgi:O-acetylhomoserine (thiol)-lyase